MSNIIYMVGLVGTHTYMHMHIMSMHMHGGERESVECVPVRHEFESSPRTESTKTVAVANVVLEVI